MDTPKLAISVRRARPSDAAALADLVNRAYSVERFFVDGLRTSTEEVARLIESGSFLVLEHDGDQASIAAAVHVDTREDVGHIGMLSVEPALQGMGLGKRLVRIAEAMCEAMGSTAVSLMIVNVREELGRWYRSLGYREVGTAPYDHRPVKQPCHFVKLHKHLAEVVVSKPATHAAYHHPGA